MALIPRDQILWKTNLCLQTERYEEMVQVVKTLLPQSQLGGSINANDDPTLNNTELSMEEKNIFQIAYKKVLSHKQRAWRVTMALEKNKETEELSSSSGPSAELLVPRDHRKQIEQEIELICYELLQIVDDLLLPTTISLIGKVFFHKMKGDYYRYLLEIQGTDVRRDILSAKAFEAYATATSLVTTQGGEEVKASDPVRLGVALNFSVFYQENLHSTKLACEIATKAIEEAFKDLNSTADDWNKETVAILGLMKENVTLWKASEEEDSDETNHGFIL